MSTDRRLLARAQAARAVCRRHRVSLALISGVAAFSTILPSFGESVPSGAEPAGRPSTGAQQPRAGSGQPPGQQAGAAPAPAAPPSPPQPPQPAGPPPAWASGLPPAGVPWASTIQDAAAKQGLDPRLLASVVWVESSFNPGAASPKGALGLAQVMPTTAADLGVDPSNPLQNLEGGARYLRHNLDRFGRTDLALAAYNAGPRTVLEAGGIPAIPETRQYVTRVLQTYRVLGG